MKRQEIINLNTKLNEFAETKGSIKFSYAIAKNVKLIEEELEAVKKAFNIPKEYIAYEEKRTALAEKFSEKDENGNPKKRTKQVNINGTMQAAEEYVLLDDSKKKFETELATLREDYKDALENYASVTKEYEEFMNENLDINFYKITYADLPGSLSPKDVYAIFEIIKD
jgi:hypothetical protein